ncbi:MAG: hypothetical protein ABIM99_00005 [Candidatus Dojkabacteria bacterium]
MKYFSDTRIIFIESNKLFRDIYISFCNAYGFTNCSVYESSFDFFRNENSQLPLIDFLITDNDDNEMSGLHLAYRLKKAMELDFPIVIMGADRDCRKLSFIDYSFEKELGALDQIYGAIWLEMEKNPEIKMPSEDDEIDEFGVGNELKFMEGFVGKDELKSMKKALSKENLENIKRAASKEELGKNDELALTKGLI